MMDDGEKNALKAFLLSRMEEPDDKVSIQLAVVTANIARMDWPGSWDTLFESLMTTVHSVSSLPDWVARGLDGEWPESDQAERNAARSIV